MSELLQEYVNSERQQLRVDRAAGVIRGVKLLGLASRNGRRYREAALTQAAPLYEGAKVNINHPKGHPLAPRDYQDRLGVVRGVEFRPGEGLFGDLHFNPMHTLSEQLVWDAEHAPQNVGMSHNVLARTSRDGDDSVVEAIVKVQSIDLVADPATTAGLFEAEGQGSRVESRGPDGGNSPLALGSSLVALDALTLPELRQHRPDLICEVENAYEQRLQAVQARLDEMIAREEAARRRERIIKLLQEHQLPLPVGEPGAESQLVSPQFIETLMRADEQSMQRLVEERARLVRAAAQWDGPSQPSNIHRPRSRDQLTLTPGFIPSRPESAKEFAASLRVV